MNEPVKPDDIDAVIHERVRLSIVAALAVSPQLSFNELKSMLGLTDGNLSAHSRTLDEAGYIVVEKSFRGRRPYTAMRLTAKGRKAFERYLETLRQIIDRGEPGRGRFVVRNCRQNVVFLALRFVTQSDFAGVAAMKRWLNDLDRILRGDATRLGTSAGRQPRYPAGGLLLMILLLALSTALCMGFYAGFREGGPFFVQWLAAIVKVPALFFLTLAVTFPSLYVFNALVGSRLSCWPSSGCLSPRWR